MPVWKPNVPDYIAAVGAKYERRKAFLAELEALCRKHNTSISHEDQHGAFILEDYSETNMKWIKQADYGKWLE